MQSKSKLGWPLDHPWTIVAAGIAVLFTVWAVGTRSSAHHVRVAFSTAFNIVTGLSVDVDGQEVGKVSGVQYVPGANGGSAIVTIGINDESYWPLHRGTTIEMRWGTTIGNGTRRFDLNPGPASNPEIPEDGIIDTSASLPAVDLDQIFGVFNKATRAKLTDMLGNLKNSVSGQANNIHNALNYAPPAVNAANLVLSDLAADQAGLSSLITNGDRVTAALASRAPAISDLVTGAAGTFNALATHATDVQNTISDVPPAMVEARATLARLDSSVGTLNTLVTTLAPGAQRLSPLAASLRPALDELHTLVPTGVSTLQTATRLAPKIQNLLTVGTTFMPLLTTDASQLAPMVACMRPFTPELASGLLGADSWNSTYFDAVQGDTPGVTWLGAQDGKYIRAGGVRAMPIAGATSLTYPQGISTAQFTQLTGQQYAEPRPAGLAEGTPVFQPECGITPNALNPADDPEMQH
jgi:ABC-type transporter Mla subunit MlaD